MRWCLPMESLSRSYILLLFYMVKVGIFVRLFAFWVFVLRKFFVIALTQIWESVQLEKLMFSVT